jgi:hypothetical protein
MYVNNCEDCIKKSKYYNQSSQKQKRKRKMLKNLVNILIGRTFDAIASIIILRAENMGFIKFKVEVDVNDI